MNRLKESYKIAWKYIVESRNYFYFVVLFFLLCAVLGFALAGELGFLNSMIKDILSRISGLNGIQLTLYIFANNVMSSFWGLVLGILFGLFPIISTGLNGLMMGYVLEKSWQVSGIMDFWRILPHGIFELPAAFLSFSLGIRLGFSLFSLFTINKKKRDKKTKEFRGNLYKSLLVFLLIIVPLLIVAAVIEGTLIALYK